MVIGAVNIILILLLYCYVVFNEISVLFQCVIYFLGGIFNGAVCVYIYRASNDMMKDQLERI
jgi:hypothetical protein